MASLRLPLLLAFGLIALGAGLLALPGAEARRIVCLEGTPPCYGGDLACVVGEDGSAVACVPDPCYTTDCF